MDDRSSLGYWHAAFAVAGAVVAAVATLVLAIIWTARRILANAERALAVTQEVASHTRPIWELDTTNAVAARLLQRAEMIEQRATMLADHLAPSEQRDK